MQAEHIAVGAAAGGLDVGRQAHIAHHPHCQLRGGLVGVQAIHLEHHFQLFGNLRIGVAAPHLVQRGEQLHPQQFQRFHIHTAVFALDDRFRRHRVAYRAAADGGDVEGGFVIHAALGQLGDEVAGDFDGGQALFGFHAGVGAAPADVNVKGHIGGAAAGDGADRAVAVKDDRFGGGNHTEVQVGGAHQADFLAAGEHYLHGTAGSALIAQGLQGFQDGGHAGLAVAAEDGAAVGGDAVAHHLGLDAAAGVNGVHMGGEQQGAAGAILAGDDIAVFVPRHLEAQGGQAVGQVGGDIPLLPGGAVNLRQAAEVVNQSFLIGHSDTSEGGGLGRRWRVRVRTGAAAAVGVAPL